MAYHGVNRGTFHANLISGPTSALDLSSLLAVDILVPNVEVKIGPNGVDATNPYVCSIHDLSILMPGRDINQPHHVAQFEAKLSATTSQYVHHMILYVCDN